MSQLFETAFGKLTSKYRFSRKMYNYITRKHWLPVFFNRKWFGTNGY